MNDLSTKFLADPRSPADGLRFRVCPTFSLSFTLDGRAFAAQEVEPYSQFWLSDAERLLMSLFGSRRGETVDGAIAAYLRLTGRAPDAGRKARLARTITGMRDGGLLKSADADTSRYDAAMAGHYLRHRPVPATVAASIMDDGGLAAGDRVLDLAGGPGVLALQFAERTDAVSLMDLSRGFLAAARREARRIGRPLTTLHESCNRLPAHDGAYDLITVSQALHWLDDVAVCRGVARCLRAGGSFFVVHCGLELADDHPLAFILGDHTPLGDKSATPFPAQLEGLSRRLSRLFEAFTATGVERHDPADQATIAGAAMIGLANVRWLRERRAFDEGFARAFLSPAHLERAGVPADHFWSDLAARCAGASAGQRLGWQDWGILHFRRGAAPEHMTAPDAPVEFGHHEFR